MPVKAESYLVNDLIKFRTAQQTAYCYVGAFDKFSESKKLKASQSIDIEGFKKKALHDMMVRDMQKRIEVLEQQNLELKQKVQTLKTTSDNYK